MRLIVILLILAALYSLYLIYFPPRKEERPSESEGPEEGWEYGDAWRQGSPDEGGGDNNVEYVEVLRSDTGAGYDDSAMLDLVGFLGSKGIRATYDSFSLGLEPAAIKTYVLKVESGREEEALGLLEEKNKGISSHRTKE